MTQTRPITGFPGLINLRVGYELCEDNKRMVTLLKTMDIMTTNEFVKRNLVKGKKMNSCKYLYFVFSHRERYSSSTENFHSGHFCLTMGKIDL